jgi:queuine/archaeosine tRNA-ribosyltransferase
LAVALEWVFSPELKSGKVVAILQDWALPPINLSAVYPTGHLASTKARTFVSFVARFMDGLDSASPQRSARLGKAQDEAGRDTERVLLDR